MSPRTVAQLAELKDQRREQILDVACGVFARQGLEATRVSDLAAAAAMSQGLLYRYFPSKEAVFSALVARATQGARAFTAEALRRPGTPRDRLHWLCASMLAGLRERPEYAALVVQAGAPTAPAEAREALARNGAATVSQLVRLLVAGQAAGEVAPGDPVELARAYFALIQGLALSQVQGGSPPPDLPRPDVVLRLFRA